MRDIVLWCDAKHTFRYLEPRTGVNHECDRQTDGRMDGQTFY